MTQFPFREGAGQNAPLFSLCAPECPWGRRQEGFRFLRPPPFLQESASREARLLPERECIFSLQKESPARAPISAYGASQALSQRTMPTGCRQRRPSHARSTPPKRSEEHTSELQS